MPRRARIALPNVPVHLIQRGNNRQPCFFADEDFRRYLDWLAEYADKTGCRIPFISAHRDKHNQGLKERFAEPAPLAEGADALTQMTHRLQTREVRAIYAKRKCTVEPAFGIIKAIMGFRQFLLRGVECVRGEWNLVCMAWNLKRLHALRA